LMRRYLGTRELPGGAHRRDVDGGHLGGEHCLGRIVWAESLTRKELSDSSRL
jgi:hypothetical protein